MVTRSLDVRKKALNPIFVTDDKKTANLKHYEEMKNLSLYGFLTICFKGRDETEADNCIRKILWQDEYYM